MICQSTTEFPYGCCLAIVGSSLLAGSLRANVLIEEALCVVRPWKLITGDSLGIDEDAALRAKRIGVHVERVWPKVRKWAPPGGWRECNERIAQECDALVRIHAAWSTAHGSEWTMQRAHELGKPVVNYVLREAEALFEESLP